MKIYMHNGEMVPPTVCFFDDDGGKTQTIQQNNAPWEGQQPYLNQVFGLAQQQAGQAQQFFPNSTVVPFSGQTESALQGMEQRAMQGSPLIDAAQGNLQQTLAGDFLNADNPYFSQMANRVTSEVLPQIQGGFNAAGRTGSGLANRAAAMGVGDAVGALAYKNYSDERGRQMQAQALAPTLAAQDYTDLAQLANVGAAREGLAADQLQEQIDRFNFAQQEPIDRLQRYAAMVSGGSYGNNSSTTQPIYSNRTGQLLGGALATAGLANSLFGKPGGGGLLQGIF